MILEAVLLLSIPCVILIVMLMRTAQALEAREQQLIQKNHALSNAQNEVTFFKDRLAALEAKMAALSADIAAREKALADERVAVDAERRAFLALRRQNIDAEVQRLYDGKWQELAANYTVQMEKVKAEQAALEGARAEYQGQLERIEAQRQKEEQVSQAVDSELDAAQRAVFNALRGGGTNIFVQGRAGSGKSTLVRFVHHHDGRNALLVSPTGITAKNIGGYTIHSAFGLPWRDILDPQRVKLRHSTKTILQNIGLLIVDEISMVRPDMLDAMDRLARRARNNDRPFGGLQVMLVGDMFQLPPVIKSSVREDFARVYGHQSAYFFDAEAFTRGDFTAFYLRQAHRQQDSELLDALGNILRRENLPDVVEYFNSAVITDKEVLDTALLITPTREVARQRNILRLDAIPTPCKTYDYRTTGEYKVRDDDGADDVPAPTQLRLKVGAVVIFLRNFSRGIVNGSSGVVTGLDEDIITVRVMETGEEVAVERCTWVEYEWVYDGDELYEKERGTYIQFPLQLGYAMTIHKAQGRTLDKVIIDLSKGTFAHGQLYVALSRTRNKADMHIARPIQTSDIKFDPRVASALRALQG